MTRDKAYQMSLHGAGNYSPDQWLTAAAVIAATGHGGDNMARAQLCYIKGKIELAAEWSDIRHELRDALTVGDWSLVTMQHGNDGA